MYRPLPKSLTISKSNIEGLGLIAKSNIKANTYLGITHMEIYVHDKKVLIRTPLGGFYNHSNDPNCIKIKKDNTYILKTLKDILSGEEITVKYTFYNID